MTPSKLLVYIIVPVPGRERGRLPVHPAAGARDGEAVEGGEGGLGGGRRAGQNEGVKVQSQLTDVGGRAHGVGAAAGRGRGTVGVGGVLHAASAAPNGDFVKEDFID